MQDLNKTPLSFVKIHFLVLSSCDINSGQKRPPAEYNPNERHVSIYTPSVQTCLVSGDPWDVHTGRNMKAL